MLSSVELDFIFGSLISIISAYPLARKIKKSGLILSFYLLSHSKRTSLYTPVPINPLFNLLIYGSLLNLKSFGGY